MALATLRVNAERVAPPRATFLGSRSKFAIDESSTCTKTNSRGRRQPRRAFTATFYHMISWLWEGSCGLNGYRGRPERGTAVEQIRLRTEAEGERDGSSVRRRDGRGHHGCRVTAAYAAHRPVIDQI